MAHTVPGSRELVCYTRQLLLTHSHTAHPGIGRANHLLSMHNNTRCMCHHQNRVAGDTLLAARRHRKEYATISKACRSDCLLVPKRAWVPNASQCTVQHKVTRSTVQNQPLLGTGLLETILGLIPSYFMPLNAAPHYGKPDIHPMRCCCTPKPQQALASSACRARADAQSHQALPSYENTGQSLRAPGPLEHGPARPASPKTHTSL